MQKFRRYHRLIAMIVALPLLVTVLTGVGAAIAEYWFDKERFAGWLIAVHTGKIFHLQSVYPILDGLGVLALLVTGISMTGLLRTKGQRSAPPNWK